MPNMDFRLYAKILKTACLSPARNSRMLDHPASRAGRRPGATRMNATTPAPTRTWSAETLRQHLPWNYVILIADGAAYMAGMAFVSAESVLPSMVRDLGGADWLVALSPSFLLMGSMMTPLILVHYIERLRLYHPFIFKMSIAQRLIPLAAGFSVLFFWDKIPTLAFWLAALTQFLMGLSGGLGSTAFWEMYGKVIPPDRRASNTAWRNGLGLVIGVAAGWFIGRILANYPGRNGYGLLLVIQGSFLILSGIFFAMIRELPWPETQERPKRSMQDVFKMIPKVLREEHSFRLFMVARALGQAHVIVIPFLALQLRKRLNLEESALGSFVQAQMLGGLLGNLLTGYLGDRLGARLPLLVSRGLALGLCVIAILARSEMTAMLCFLLIGLVININQIAENLLVLELASPANRPALLAMQSIFLMPVTLAFGLLSKTLFQASGNLLAPAAIAGLFILCSFIILKKIKDPRHPLL